MGFAGIGGTLRSGVASRVARNIADALVHPKSVKQLALLPGNDIPRLDMQCRNMLCEKIGKPCICRLATVLQQMTSLRSLLLTGNGLEDLPDTLWALRELEVLDLRDNQLTMVSPRISELESLKILKLSGNPRIVLPSESLASMRLVTVMM